MAYKKPSDGAPKPSLDLFMILGNILVDKDLGIYEQHINDDSFDSIYSSFMVLRYLSMNSNPNVRKIPLDYLYILEGMSEHPALQYKLLMEIVPQTHNRFTPYIKSGFPKANG